jgi:hypothetical protein
MPRLRGEADQSGLLTVAEVWCIIRAVVQGPISGRVGGLWFRANQRRAGGLYRESDNGSSENQA